MIWGIWLGHGVSKQLTGQCFKILLHLDKSTLINLSRILTSKFFFWYVTRVDCGSKGGYAMWGMRGSCEESLRQNARLVSDNFALCYKLSGFINLHISYLWLYIFAFSSHWFLCVNKTNNEYCIGRCGVIWCGSERTEGNSERQRGARSCSSDSLKDRKENKFLGSWWGWNRQGLNITSNKSILHVIITLF